MAIVKVKKRATCAACGRFPTKYSERLFRKSGLYEDLLPFLKDERPTSKVVFSKESVLCGSCIRRAKSALLFMKLLKGVFICPICDLECPSQMRLKLHRFARHAAAASSSGPVKSRHDSGLGTSEESGSDDETANGRSFEPHTSDADEEEEEDERTGIIQEPNSSRRQRRECRKRPRMSMLVASSIPEHHRNPLVRLERLEITTTWNGRSLISTDVDVPLAAPDEPSSRAEARPAAGTATSPEHENPSRVAQQNNGVAAVEEPPDEGAQTTSWRLKLHQGFKCALCGEAFLTQEWRRDHVRAMHQNACPCCGDFFLRGNVDEEDEVSGFCGNCDSLVDHLGCHLLYLHPVKLCFSCDRAFVDEDTLRAHQVSCHS